MTNDELLAGFLDRSLSEDQLLEFESRRASDPAFDAEVTDMLTVEGLLSESAPTAVAPVGFFSTVEAGVVAKIAAGTVGGVGLGYVFSNVWTWVIGTSALIVGTAAVYLATTTSDPAPVKVEAHTAQPSTPSEQASPQPATIEEPAQAAPETSISSNSVSTSTRPETPSRELPAPTDNRQLATSNPPAALQQLIQELESCTAHNLGVRCAQLAINIGVQFRQQGDHAQATQYLERGLQSARAARTVQQQVQALAELARVARVSGNAGLAVQRYQEAIKLAAASGLPMSDLQAELDGM